MRCADPVLCYTNGKGKRIFRHFSLATKIFKEHLHNQVFDCGKCLFCRKKKAFELAARCVLHASVRGESCFLTLTYDEKKEGYHNEFNYPDIQKFKKRLRARVYREDGRTLEIFNVHEYGRNGKKHWHLLVFGFNFRDRRIFTFSNHIPLYTSELLGELWSHGFSTIGDVSEGSAMYQSQYMEKDFQHRNVGTSKRSHSKHSGLGRPYFEKYYEQVLTLGYVPFNGHRMPVPRYFQKIAHKHWCHFHMPSAFFDTAVRKALYRPFSGTQVPNSDMARLWDLFCLHKQEKIQRLESEWSEVISRHLTDGSKPDFLKAAENALHDLRNKNNQEIF